MNLSSGGVNGVEDDSDYENEGYHDVRETHGQLARSPPSRPTVGIQTNKKHCEPCTTIEDYIYALTHFREPQKAAYDTGNARQEIYISL